MTDVMAPAGWLGVMAEDAGAEVLFPYALKVIGPFKFVALFWRGFGEVKLEEVAERVAEGEG